MISEGAERRERARVGRKSAGTDQDKETKIKRRPRSCLSGEDRIEREGEVKRPELRYVEAFK